MTDARRKSNLRAKEKKVVQNALWYLLLTILALYLVLPFFFMVSRSLMSSDYVGELPIKFFPDAAHLSVEGFRELFGKNNYFLYLGNTLKILAFNIITVPLSASLCAYGFAKIKFPGSKIVFGMVMSSMMIPGTVTQVPLYIMFANLGWTQDIRPLVIPAMFGGGAVNIFLLIQFMRSIPNELENAAKIDGANLFQCYARIVMPLCIPVVTYVMVGTFGSVWSDFYGPLIYLKSRSAYTLAVAIYYDCIGPRAQLNSINVQMAAGVFMSILPILVFVLYQRKLIDGIMIGGIKG